MARRLSILIFLVGLLPAVAFAQETGRVCRTGNSGLNIRSQPSIHGRRIGGLSEGTTFEMGNLSRNGRWVRVVTSRGAGWVSRSYVCEDGAGNGSASGPGTGAGSSSGTVAGTGTNSGSGAGGSGNVVAGTCDGPSCPFWIEDVNAAIDASSCPSEMDADLVAKWQRGETLTPSEFVRFVAPMAQRSEAETGVPASVTIAQAILETAWGKTARRAANNLFGIKGSGNAGSVRLWTREYSRGRWIRIRANFAAYHSLEDSVVAHGRLLSERPLYARAMEVRNDPAAFARALQRAGYATDPQYANKLLSLINGRNLRQYDGARRCET